MARYLTMLAAAALAASLLATNTASARGTISVPNGAGGFKEYVPPAKPLAGRTGISIDNGRGWQAYNPPLRPVAGPTGISVGDGNGGFRPYFPPARQPIGASTTFGGRTTTSIRNAAGGHTVLVMPAQ